MQNTQRFARTPLNSAIWLLLALTPAAHASHVPALTAYVGEGALGGSVNNYASDTQTVNNANKTSVASTSRNNTAADGSYAHAQATASFGGLHAYTDAHRTYAYSGGSIGDAQAHATADFTEILPVDLTGGVGSSVSGNQITYTMNLALGGQRSTPTLAFSGGLESRAGIHWAVFDITQGQYLSINSAYTTDSALTLNVPVSFTAHVGDLVELFVQLDVFSYVMSTNDPNYLTAYADYSHTLNVYLDSHTAGANLVGQSGHNYAAPTVPEPATWLSVAMAVAALFRARGFSKVTRLA